ncbi:Inhibitor of apoptosis-promoting Bax1-related protein [Coemansia sp. RSA 2049]|nr:Inhibitor of apoptosis-promoting Bax1-related protein [Coemansia sp. RSA 2049]
MYDRKEGGGLGAFFNGTTLRPHTQRQLVQIYTTLASTVACSMGGCYLAGRIPWLGNHELLTVGGTLLGTLAVYAIKPTKANLTARQMLLWAVSMLTGTLVRPVVEEFLYWGDEDLVYMALGSALTLFASFALAAIVSPSSRVVYAVGAAVSALTSLLWLSLVAYVYPTHALHMLTVLVSLAVSCVSVVIHTHGILELANAGAELDPVTHSLTLFNDLALMFVRLLVLLSGDRRRREEQRGKGKTRSKCSSSSSSFAGRRHFGSTRSSGSSWAW